jgi:RimJ/RimL family protein N-acetyltransferase
LAKTDIAGNVRLTPLHEADCPILFEWINDRELVELSSTFKPVAADDHRRWFDGIQNRPDTRIFGIRLKDDPALIGTCQLLKINHSERSAELQIRIGDPSARGRGIGTEAVRQLVAFGFRELNLNRITLHVFDSNTIAQRAYEKAGFVRQGVIPAAASIGGRPVDALVMAIVNE